MPVNVYHGDVPTAEIHIPYNWTYANAAARTGAGGFVSGDVGKLARQTDNDTFWILLTTGPTWGMVFAKGDGNSAHYLAGDGTYTAPAGGGGGGGSTDVLMVQVFS